MTNVVQDRLHEGNGHFGLLNEIIFSVLYLKAGMLLPRGAHSLKPERIY